MSPERAAGDVDAPVSVHGGVVVFRVGEAEFGLAVADVREVLRTPHITRVPRVPDALLGVVSVRGEVVPVLDLGRRLLGRPAERPGRLLIVVDPASGGPVALLADEVTGMTSVPEEGLAPPPAEADAALPEGFLAGVVTPESDRVVSILNLEPVLAIREPTDKEH